MGDRRTETLSLPRSVPAALIGDVNDKLAIAAEEARDCRLSADGSTVDFVLQDTSRLENVSSLLVATVEAMLRGHRDVETEVLWRNEVAPAHRGPVWDDLVASGLVSGRGAGCVALHGDAARVVDALDRTHHALALDRYRAVDHRYPTLLPITAMERCDYLKSFPQHVTFAPHFRENVEAVGNVATADATDRPQRIADALLPPTHILSPAICFHTYHGLEDRIVPRPLAVTAVGRCFRWEGARLTTLERLWDFTMREIVFIGDAAWVGQQREQALRDSERLVERLQLDARIEIANDPFFVTSYAAKRYFQLVTGAKYELRLTLPYSGGSLAVSSFNIHQDFFGRSFNIRASAASEDHVHTGCFAAGLERWSWALFAQHGPRVGDWPAPVRRELGL